MPGTSQLLFVQRRRDSWEFGLLCRRTIWLGSYTGAKKLDSRVWKVLFLISFTILFLYKSSVNFLSWLWTSKTRSGLGFSKWAWRKAVYYNLVILYCDSRTVHFVSRNLIPDYKIYSIKSFFRSWFGLSNIIVLKMHHLRESCWKSVLGID